MIQFYYYIHTIKQVSQSYKTISLFNKKSAFGFCVTNHPGNSSSTHPKNYGN